MPGDHESCQGHLASRYAGLGEIALIFSFFPRFMSLLFVRFFYFSDILIYLDDIVKN